VEIDVLPGDRVRIPDPSAGIALAIRRYRDERAFVLHPADFHRLQTLDSLAGEALAIPPLELSQDAIDAHIEESTPGEPVTDPATLDALFGV
jgi:hypothetical protein